jgi:hypothetical protein
MCGMCKAAFNARRYWFRCLIRAAEWSGPRNAILSCERRWRPDCPGNAPGQRDNSEVGYPASCAAGHRTGELATSGMVEGNVGLWHAALLAVVPDCEPSGLSTGAPQCSARFIPATSLAERAPVVGVVLPAASIISTRRLQVLFPELMLVPLVPGDAAANRPEHAVTRHMAGERAGGSTGQASKSTRRGRGCAACQHHSNCEDYCPHGFSSLTSWPMVASGNLSLRRRC